MRCNARCEKYECEERKLKNPEILYYCSICIVILKISQIPCRVILDIPPEL